MTDDDLPGYFGRDGQPMTLSAWLARFRDEEYRRVGSDEVATPLGVRLWVSTVWLGIDHSFGGPQPVIFESMVFDGQARENPVGSSSWVEVAMRRYATEAEAIAGHHELVEIARTRGLEGLIDD